MKAVVQAIDLKFRPTVKEIFRVMEQQICLLKMPNSEIYRSFCHLDDAKKAKSDEGYYSRINRDVILGKGKDQTRFSIPSALRRVPKLPVLP
jgi:hypothetical protein